jgi:hypothetical protein
LAVASLELLQMIMMVVAPAGVANAGAQAYHFIPGFMEESVFDGCEATCLYRSLVARGDRAGLRVTGRHLVAEQARAKRVGVSSGSVVVRILRYLRGYLPSRR